jgi:hypothetical protein
LEISLTIDKNVIKYIKYHMSFLPVIKSKNVYKNFNIFQVTGKQSGLSNSHQQIHDFNMPYVQVPQTIYVPKRPANGGDRRSAFFRANRLKVPTSTGAAPGGKQTKPLRILHEPVDIQIHLHDKSQLGKLVQKGKNEYFMN